MSNEENTKTANLDFFKSAIVEPALSMQRTSRLRGLADVVSDLSVIEGAHWASLGAQIGYFDEEAAEELVSSSQEAFNAWSNLQSRNILSPQEDWARVIRVGEGGHPTLNKDLFSLALEITPEIRELLQQTFQMFLLLTAENILDRNSQYFVDSIGWTDDIEWNLRRSGLTTDYEELASFKVSMLRIANELSSKDIGLLFVNELDGSDIGLGFANVLNYWEEMNSSSASLRSRVYGVYDPSVVRERRIVVSFSEDLATSPVWNFSQDARAILSRRFNLSKVEIVERYFELAGEFVNRGRENNAAWLAARSKVFQELAWLITYAGGGGSIKQHLARLWNLFTGGTATSEVHENIPRPKKPRKGLWPEPPREFR
jgi:hypothetical protein